MPKSETKVGLIDGKFSPCPKMHCCVSTMSDIDDKKHYIEPISYQEDIGKAMDKIINIVNSMKRTKILKKTDNYIHALFTTALIKFKDDVQFYFDDNHKIIHFKSQSRLKGYDYNTNRNRMEKIRKLFLSE